MSHTKITLLISLLVLTYTQAIGQNDNLKTKNKKFYTTDKTLVQGEIGYLTVPENYSDSESRKIKIKYIKLKSLSRTPKEPIIYLEGGGSTCTWQAETPEYLDDWLPILEVSDLIFIDQRGTTDRKLTYIEKDEYPIDFLVSEEVATKYYQNMSQKALKEFKNKGVDVLGYDITAHAKDINELTKTLEINKYSIFGFSYGTHIGMALMELYKESVVNAILVSSDGINQSFNYPLYLDEQFDKISKLMSQDNTLNKTIPDLNELLKKVMTKLEEEPVIVNIKHPLTKKSIQAKIGPFGLALILRLDIDDSNDIPIIPRLLYSIDQNNYSILEWFVQKRIAFVLALPGNGINQNVASWASPERWGKIKKQAEESIFGNVVNFPFHQAKDLWPRQELDINTLEPIESSIRTLFVTGDLDCRTPVQQVNETRKSFSNSTHLVVKNAGHEQALWNITIFDKAIPQFLLGNDVSNIKAINKDIKFIPLNGANDKHPSINLVNK